jgi:beta-glucosidase
MHNCVFPEGFKWGVATASYQIEGAVHEDGRGDSIWDRFSHIPGNIPNNDNGDVACDHYHRYKEDVQILKKLKVASYRFSIAWPRIFPDGYGKVNPKGIRFYSDLVDELLANGIEPVVTLYHWDLPQRLQEEGGWVNRKTAEHFADYCRVMFEALGDRVKNWITINEPWVCAFCGHYTGDFAPGLRDFSAALEAAHNMLRGHGMVVRMFREMGLEGQIGITLNLCPREPATDSPADIEAARINDGYGNRWFLDPVFKGAYPADMVEFYRAKGITLPKATEEDMRLISEKVDFLGINYYYVDFTAADPANWPLGIKTTIPLDYPITEYKWPIVPRGMSDLLVRVSKDYGNPAIYITENGASYNDVVSVKGEVLDEFRIDYLERHMIACHDAISKGVNLKGYFVWTLLDDFEWNTGFGNRFGLVYMDRKTCDRIIKKSAYWYTVIIENNGIIFAHAEG